MVLWLKLLVIIVGIMFLVWFILYIKPDIEERQEDDGENDGYENITDEELNQRLKIAQRKIAIEQLKKIEKRLEKSIKKC